MTNVPIADLKRQRGTLHLAAVQPLLLCLQRFDGSDQTLLLKIRHLFSKGIKILCTTLFQVFRRQGPAANLDESILVMQ